ncbi:uncharacterized protein LOC108930862 [Scleropages formosus]|uniref:Zinc finger protein 654 n=1 Tax=Scleropages formosus TaxID=113540 RepID=A0A8C9SHI1_SCLFO|nr:uncharacterized protein LOC108930862 [Scleropages formosus]
MAEEESDLESERLKEELESLWDLTRTDQHGVKSKIYCSRFCELVEEHTARWQVPLPQLQVLRTALCYFTHSTASFPCGCEHVQYALSSLALSFFELLLFFGKDEFLEDPLKDILLSFQDCFLCLGRHKNMHLQLVNQIVQDGGPWENPILQAILKESAQSQDEVKQYLSSEVPVFFELRIRYLLACERIQEAVALAKTCIEHPEARRHLYFHQVYLTCLWKASLFDLLRKEMAVIDGRDAVEILCNTEREEKDDLLLAFSKEFLTQQLQSGDMYCMWDLVFIWSKLHLRANPSKQDFMEECHQLMMCANNVKSIFPFMKIIIDEMGNEGLQFCVELCARALQMDLHHDPVTKSLIYKTIAFLLPNDLEVCRACALLVFFLERTVESYKTVYLLYTHPDQEYHVDSSLIKNDIRFEILQILKKGLFFDPEFWNLITLRRNCLKLMNEKVMKAALNEIMEEDKWIPNYCMKEPYKFHSDCSANQAATHNRKDANKPEAKCGGVALEANATPPARRRGRKPGTRFPKVAGTCQLRRSFRQLDMAQESSNRQRGSRQQRHLARQVEKKTLKRRGRKPRWLLQDTARQEDSGAPKQMRHFGKKAQHLPTEMTLPECDTGQETEERCKMSSEHRSDDTPVSRLAVVDTETEDVVSQEAVSAMPSLPLLDPQVTAVTGVLLEISLPDNEVMDSFSAEHDMGLQVHRVLQNQEETTGLQDVPLEYPFIKPFEKETHTALELQNESESSAHSSAETCGELTIQIRSTNIHELHNYCKIFVDNTEMDPQSSGSVLELEPPMQKENQCEIKESKQSPSGEHNTLSPADATKPDKTSQITVVETKNEVRQSRHPHKFCIPLDASVPHNCTSGSEQKAHAPNGLNSHLQIAIISPHNMDISEDAIGASKHITANSADGTGCVSRNVTAVSDVIVCGWDSSLDEEQPAVLLQTEGSDDISAGYLPGAPPKIESSVLKYRCRQCSKEFRGGNIMRHAVAHLQKDKFKCIFCGKVFKRRHIAERHLTKHIEKIKMRNSLISNSTRESGSCEALDHANLSLADDEDKKALRVGAGDTISSNRKINNKPKDVHHAEEEKMTESRRAKLKANGFIEAGQLPSGKEGYCCPADGCDMVFPRRELSLIRHAMKSHPDDAKVQEYAFDWRKGKCHFCKRVFLSLPHYKDHVLEHNHPLKHPCLHHDCKRRFKTQTELRGHMRNHEHFQAKCSFAGCHQRFNHLGQLFSHESSHYLTPEAKSSSVKRDSEVQGSPGRQDQEDDQDDDSFVWREKSDHKTYVLSGGGKGTTNSAASNSEQQVSPAADAGLGPEPAECANSAESCFSDRQLVNGHSKHEGGLVISASVESGSPQKDEEETKAGVTDLEMRVTPASSTGQRRSAAQGHKAAREEERPPYGGTSNKPFLRLSPSAYLDEKYISMPKRRKPSADPSPAPAEQKEPHAGTQRQRCTKCFCSFGSTEELQKHLSSNKCMSLFDSDEEGAW